MEYLDIFPDKYGFNVFSDKVVCLGYESSRSFANGRVLPGNIEKLCVVLQRDHPETNYILRLLDIPQIRLLARQRCIYPTHPQLRYCQLLGYVAIIQNYRRPIK